MNRCLGSFFYGIILATILQGTARAQSFEPPRNIPTGAAPNSVKAADFNNDGKLDLIVGRDSTAMSLMLGNGDGTFQTATNLSAGTQPRFVDVADFDGDGKADIAVANYGSNNISVLLGSGNGTFKTPVNYAAGTNPRGVAAGNLNGKIGLVVPNVANNNVSVFVGNGDGTFRSAVNYPVGNNPTGVALGDLNGDGKLDIITANYFSDSVSVLLGNGDGTFQTAINSTVGTNPSSVAVGIFNNDNNLDVVVANNTSNNITILRGIGDGTFQTPQNLSAGSDPVSVTTAEFNHDSFTDLMVVNYNDGNVSERRGIGNFFFHSSVNYPAGSGATYVTTADFNGDGWTDAAVVNETSATISILINNKGLNLWLKLDENTGTTVADSSASGFNGSLVNGPTWTPAQVNSGVSFDGVNDYLDAPTFSWPAGGPVTVAFWNYVSSTPTLPDGYTFGAGTDPLKPMSALVPHPSGVVYWDYGGRVQYNSYASYMDKWTHVALVSGGNGGNFRGIYLNGQLVASATTSDGPSVPLTGLHIGHNQEFALNTRHSRCKIDDFRIYNRILTPAEITALTVLAPTAAPDGYGANSGQTLTVPAPGVLSNDTGTPGDTLTAVLDSSVTHGNVTLNANGSFTYTSTNGYTGLDTYTYHVNNGHGGITAPTTVTLNVINLSVASITPSSGVVSQTLTNVTINGVGFKAGIPLPPGTVNFNGHDYLNVTTAMNWPAARDYCTGIGGHLVTIENAAENTFVQSLITQLVWIGLGYDTPSSSYKWVTGEPVPYTDWGPGEPSDLAPYTVMRPQNGTWNDTFNDSFGFVCEFDKRGTAVKLKQGQSQIFGTNIRSTSSNVLLADFNLAGAALGSWDVIVTDPDYGVTSTLPAAFQISAATTTTAVNSGSSATYKTIAQNVSLSASVTAQYGTLNQGTVTFQVKNGANNLGSAVTSGALVNGATGPVSYTLPAGTPAGTYTISASYNGTAGYLGSSDVTKVVTVSPATLSVTGNDATRKYGESNPAFSGTLTGVQSGDGITASFNSTAAVTSPVGTYPIAPTLLDPNNKLSNYTINSTNGSLTVSKAPLSAVAFNASRSYGAANPTFSGVLSGVINGDNILATYDTAATAASPAGVYPIVPQLVDQDNKAGNYIVNLSNGALTITKAPLTVTPADTSRPYGVPNPILAGTITGIQNNDNITASYSTTATAISLVGTYPITATLADPGNKLGSYATTLSVGTLIINKAAPTLLWPSPANIVAGNALTDVQLNATAHDSFSGAALTGTFEYSPAAGTVLSAGTHQALSVTFAASDAANYVAATQQTFIDVDPAVPPTVTSALTASVQKDVAFAYTITADGSLPMTFNAVNLPPGLSFAGTDITGSPSAAGLFSIPVTATNFGGSNTKILKLTVLGSGENHAPAVTSAAASSANPATTGVPVTFTAQASDDDGDALDYAWDFGDGTSATGASVTKTYLAAGVYSVSLIISDGQASVSQHLNLVVKDQDASGNFFVEKVKLALNFTKTNKDSLSLSGQIAIPSNFTPSGKTVRVLIGSLDFSGVLDAKGKSTDKSIGLKLKRGATTATIAVSLKNRNLFAPLAELGFSKTIANAGVEMPVVVVLDGQSYIARPILKYALKPGKSATGKK